MANNDKTDKKLAVENLTISFRTNQGMVRAVRGVDFDLYRGETLAIVGESGSGKSVTSKAIMGILEGNSVIDDGKIIYEDQDLTKIQEEDFHKLRGDKIGMIFQDPMSSLNPIMRIGKQITEGMIINGKHLKNRKKDLAHEALQRYSNAKARRKDLKKELKRKKKELKEAGRESEFESIATDIRKERAELKKTIKTARKAYRKKRSEASKTVREEWKAKKAEYAQKIDGVKSTLKTTVDNDEKKRLKHEIEGLKEELLRHKKVTKKQARERAIEIMGEVGIPDPEKRLKQYPFQFSGGMRQRIVIAIALTADPDLLICDEPTTALDVTIQSQILELIKRLKTERDLSVIFITHDLGVVANMADRIAVMYAGKIVEIGTAEDIFYNPKHPYTWALLSSVPDIDSEERLLAIPGTPPNMLFPPKGDAFAERNPYAMEIDFEKEPPFFKVSDSHYAATWLLHPDAPKTAMPDMLQHRIAKMRSESIEEEGTS
ncbi:MAG: oligopeptide/dipeptide ABC transporter ATP-binding protein [Candidatus Izemoplasmataceae bacterium]